MTGFISQYKVKALFSTFVHCSYQRIYVLELRILDLLQVLPLCRIFFASLCTDYPYLESTGSCSACLGKEKQRQTIFPLAGYYFLLFRYSHLKDGLESYSCQKKSSGSHLEKLSIKITWVFIKLGRRGHLANFHSLLQGMGPLLKRHHNIFSFPLK